MKTRIMEITYAVKVLDDPRLIAPDRSKVKSGTDWLPTRHGVLLNEYMRWCQESRGTKQQFAENLIKEIELGKHPLLLKNELDHRPEPFTVQSITSQLDWIAQDENIVIDTKPDSTVKVFYPNHLMVLTTKQKSEEATRARLRKEEELKQAKAKQEEKARAEATVKYILGNLDDTVKKHLYEALSKESKMSTTPSSNLIGIS